MLSVKDHSVLLRRVSLVEFGVYLLIGLTAYFLIVMWLAGDLLEFDYLNQILLRWLPLAVTWMSGGLYLLYFGWKNRSWLRRIFTVVIGVSICLIVPNVAVQATIWIGCYGFGKCI